MSNIGRPRKNAEAVASFTASFNQLKQERNVTHQQIADAIGLKAVQTITNWANGHGMPSEKNIGLLCQAFQVSRNKLLGIEGKTLMEIIAPE